MGKRHKETKNETPKVKRKRNFKAVEKSGAQGI
jgi:hypothetical protein